MLKHRADKFSGFAKCQAGHILELAEFKDGTSFFVSVALFLCAGGRSGEVRHCWVRCCRR